jgi:rhodanese-related sulfurtransferase
MRLGAIAGLAVALPFTLAYAHTDLTPAEVKALLDAGGAMVVVDVREEAEYCDTTYSPPGHIQGAINMPWYAGDLEERYTELDPTDSTIVVCRSGARSNVAANFLDGVGFTNVFDMLGGMNAWLWDTEVCYEASVDGADGARQAVLTLQPASPNPFSASTRITYAIPHTAAPARVTLKIYESLGHLVATVVDRSLDTGVYHATWSGKDNRGRQVPSGVYFYRLTWSDQVRTRRAVLLK